MFENNNTIATYATGKFRKTSLAAALSLMASGIASPAIAGASFETDGGWTFGANGHVPVFALATDDDSIEEDAFRITTGFNPATLQFNVSAPTQNGLDVSAHFQLNNHFAGADGVQNSGFGREGFGRVSGVESRVSKINVAGDFGTLTIGKAFGVFGVPAIGDAGSAMGVGGFSPNQGDATAGRIGHGYFYANFNPQVKYASPNMGGVSFTVGLFQPEKPKFGGALPNDIDSSSYTAADQRENEKFKSDFDGAIGTESPRIEANLVFSQDMVTLWSSAFTQAVSVNGNPTTVDGAAIDDFTMSGIDFGGALALGDLNLRANYATTEGTGNGVFGGHGIVGGSQEESASQWYGEATYDINKTTLGASYGEGEDDLGGTTETDLAMLFARYQLTDTLTLLGEAQSFGSDSGDADSSTLIVGAQFTY